MFGDNQPIALALIAVGIPLLGNLFLAWLALKRTDQTKDKVEQVHLLINSEFTKFKEMIAEKELARGNLEGRAQLLREQAEALGAAAVAREGETKAS